VRFALEEQACYRLMFDLSQPRMAPLPELFAAEARARATMSNHVRLLVQEGDYEGDPEIIGFSIWSAIHGVMTLHLAGKLAAGGEFETVLAETMRAVTSAYRRKS
jgi:hypothetical protein